MIGLDSVAYLKHIINSELKNLHQCNGYYLYMESYKGSGIIYEEGRGGVVNGENKD